MSFSVKKIGKDKEAIKAAVRESIVRQNKEAEIVADVVDKIVDAAYQNEGHLFVLTANGHMGGGALGSVNVMLTLMRADELV